MSRLHFLLYLLHVYTSIHAAPLSTIPSLGLINGEPLNLAAPTNFSLPNHTNLGSLPTDPYSHRVPGSDVTIVFRNYTIAISGSDSNRCVEEALGDALTHGDRILRKVQAAREYAWGTVELSIIPLGSMRWLDLSYAAKSLYAWLRIYDSVDLNFDIVIQGVGLVGTGRLANVI